MIVLIVILLPLFLLIYAWLLYPAMLRLWVYCNKSAASREASGVVTEMSLTDSEKLTVAILLSAYNEEKHIKLRLENLVSLSFPQSALQIHVGVDSSTDATAAIARKFAENHDNVYVQEFTERRGKAAVLRDMILGNSMRGVGDECRRSDVLRQSNGHTGVKADILVFTDANTLFCPDALEKLVVPFANPMVGGVCGRLEMGESGKREAGSGKREAGSGKREAVALGRASPERFYWDWEARLKECESALDSCLGANGAIYAVRRGLFWDEIPDNAIVDDFIIGMKVREKGFRMVYEPGARAWEALPQPVDEWERRVRIGAGGYQALKLCRKCLSPKYGRFAWMFWSHKALRWFTPHILIFLVGCSVFGVRCSVFGACRVSRVCGVCSYLPFAVCGAVLFLALLGGFANESVIGRVCRHFLTMQAALFIGFIRFCRGGLKGYWQRTPRG